MKNNANIDQNYETYYKRGNYSKVYPTEFVMRAFLQTKLPGLKMEKPNAESKILEVGFGDGRNTVFLCEQGWDVSGVEITQGICDQTEERIRKLGFMNFRFSVGRNSRLPFPDNSFDYLLASHACYYLDDGETFLDNMKEYARVLKKNAYAIFDVIHVRPDVKDDINIMNDAEKVDGCYIIRNDPLGIRNGYRFQAFETKEEVIDYLSPLFFNFSIGTADNNFFGVTERLFWVVCQVR